jgi:hypothetical protein
LKHASSPFVPKQIYLGKKTARRQQPLIRIGNYSESDGLLGDITMEVPMGRGILLWLLGVPIPIIILLALFWH